MATEGSDMLTSNKFIYNDEIFTFQAKHALMNSRKKYISSLKTLKNGKSSAYIKKTEQDSQETHLEELRRFHVSSSAALKTFTTKLIIKITGTFFQSILSIFACLVYIIETYFEDGSSAYYSATSVKVFRVLEIVIASLFTVDYLWGLYQAKNKKKFLFNFVNIIDLFTILPVFVSLIGENNFKAKKFGFARILRAIRVFRILRLYRLFGVGKKNTDIKSVDKSDIKRKTVIIITTLLAIIFIATGILHSLNNLGYFDFRMAMPTDEQYLNFDAAFYFMVTIVTTVAFGDIRPASVSAKITVGIFILVMIVLASKQLTELSRLMKFNSQYRNAYQGEHTKHIVLIGSITHNSLFKFLKEFYHPDHNFSSLVKVVLIQENAPTKEITSVLNNPVFEENVHYITGNIFHEEVMGLAHIDTSIGVFILNNQFNKDTRKDDTYALLACKAVREYRSEVKIYLQLCNPEFLRHTWADWDEVMSIQTFKMGLISANLSVPGVSTFISNLIISSGGAPIRKELDNLTWVLEYSHGLAHEIYTEITIPEKYVGLKFIDVVKEFYAHNGTILIGIKTYYGMVLPMISNLMKKKHSIWTKKKDIEQEEEFQRKNLRPSLEDYDIIINPINYVIQANDKGVVISKSFQDANVFDQSIKNSNNKGLLFKLKNKNQSAIKPETPRLDERYDEIIKNGFFIQKKTESFGELTDDVFIMWKTDIRGKVFDHIIVIGKIEHYAHLLEYLTLKTHQYICFMNENPPSEEWAKIKVKYPRAIYLECNMKNIEELSKAAINYAAHVVLLTWLDENSIPDSEIISIAKIIEENFTVPILVELVEEFNMRFLKYKPNGLFDGVKYNTWPRYAASTIIFSSSMDSLMAQAFHSSSFILTVGKLVCPDMVQNQKQYDENLDLNLYIVPDEIVGKCTYGQLFNYFCSLQRPIISLAIIRAANTFENELPYVFCNPNSNAPLMKGDKILVLGTPSDKKAMFTSLNNQKKIAGAEELIDPMQSLLMSTISKKKKQNFLTTRIDDIFDNAKNMVMADDIYESNDQFLLEKLSDELKKTDQDRKKIIELNNKMKVLLEEAEQIRQTMLIEESKKEQERRKKETEGQSKPNDENHIRKKRGLATLALTRFSGIKKFHPVNKSSSEIQY